MSRRTFELNGRTYDTLTGAMVNNSTPAAAPAPAAPSRSVTTVNPMASRLQQRPAPRHISMDGMVSAAPAAVPVSPAAAPKPQTIRLASKPQHVSAHRPQPTQTLMRRAVKAPAYAATEGFSVAAKPLAAPAVARPARGVAPSVIPKMSSSAVDPHRTLNAQAIGRSQSVQRFGSAASAPKPAWNGVSATTVSSAALAPQPAAGPAQPQAPQAARNFNNFASPTRRPATRPAAPARRAPAPKPVEDDDQDIFVRALAEAKSHEEAAPAVKTRKRGKRLARVMGIAASAALLLAMAGFIGFQNRDDIRLQLASAKAGFPASAPLYKPDGFALASMKYTAGSVASVYQHGNSQNITITQKKSNWDSQTLLENFVATKSGDYQGFQSNGRTVYVYGKGNATWVNGGVWYEIKASDNVSNEQLVRIAASM